MTCLEKQIEETKARLKTLQEQQNQIRYAVCDHDWDERTDHTSIFRRCRKCQGFQSRSYMSAGYDDHIL
jgi:hypothetical protein